MSLESNPRGKIFIFHFYAKIFRESTCQAFLHAFYKMFYGGFR
jgi:hypothetical protein